MAWRPSRWASAYILVVLVLQEVLYDYKADFHGIGNRSVA